jgi:hypothetical protein
MTKTEIKSQITQLIDNMPEHMLQELLNYLKTGQWIDQPKEKLVADLNRIFHEDQELLKKLAE